MLTVLRSTPRYAVIDKPAGLLSVPGKGADKADCAAARVRAMFPGATGPLTVHRLDQETSGVMVFALDPETHRALSGQFEARRVVKRYEALIERGDEALPVDAALGDDEARWPVVDLPIRLDPDNRPMQVHDPERGKPSVTRYRVLGHEPYAHGGVSRGVTRIEFAPETGRSHQLRVHAAHERGLGRAILGDSLYGDPSSAPRLLLHATVLGFEDPGSGEVVRVESGAPF